MVWSGRSSRFRLLVQALTALPRHCRGVPDGSGESTENGDGREAMTGGMLDHLGTMLLPYEAWRFPQIAPGQRRPGRAGLTDEATENCQGGLWGWRLTPRCSGREGIRLREKIIDWLSPADVDLSAGHDKRVPDIAMASRLCLSTAPNDGQGPSGHQGWGILSEDVHAFR